MPRKVRDAALETRTARSRLKTRHDPYFRLIEPGLHLGYRKLASGPGTWIVRRYSGGRYSTENLRMDDGLLVVADDFSEPDNHSVLSFGQAQEQAKAKRPAGATRGTYKVADAMKAYFAELTEQRKPTKEAERRYRVFIEPTLGGDDVAELTTERIEKWHRAIAATPPRLRTKKGAEQRYGKLDDSDDAIRARQATANRILTILKAGLNLAWRKKRKFVPSDDAWRGVEPFHDVEKARVRFLSVAEAVRHVNACEPDFRKLVQGALQSGARYGQLARLVVSDFNPTVGNLRLTSRKGKNSKLKTYYATLTAEGVEFFKSVCLGKESGELIFPNEGRIQRAVEMECLRLERSNGAAPTKTERAAIENSIREVDDGRWHDSEQARPMLEACEHAKISPPISFHILRHTWASHAVMNGVPLLVVAKNMGHADTRMVEKHYGHLAPSYIADAIRAGAPKFGFKPDGKVVAL